MRRLAWIGIVRHGESTGNVAAAAAEESRSELIDIGERDADVDLSENGEEQAEAVGRWLRGLRDDERPTVVVVSPYLRTRRTAEILLADLDVPVRHDERLRDRELGTLDLHTARGIRARFPDEVTRRDRWGKFYYRPPGGESWADVLLRLRSVLRDLSDDHPDGRVLLVSHDAVVSLTRYLLEDLDEPTLMADARETTIANCSVSSWSHGDDGWERERFNAVEHLEADAEAEATAEEDTDAAL